MREVLLSIDAVGHGIAVDPPAGPELPQPLAALSVECVELPGGFAHKHNTTQRRAPAVGTPWPRHPNMGLTQRSMITPIAGNRIIAEITG